MGDSLSKKNMGDYSAKRTENWSTTSFTNKPLKTGKITLYHFAEKYLTIMRKSNVIP